MLKLTYGQTSSTRVSKRPRGTRTPAAAAVKAAPSTMGRAPRAFDYRELCALADTLEMARADFSERFRRAWTLKAGWIFDDADPIQRARARLAGPVNR